MEYAGPARRCCCFGSLALVLGLPLALRLVRSITRPDRAGTHTADRVAALDLRHDIAWPRATERARCSPPWYHGRRRPAPPGLPGAHQRAKLRTTLGRHRQWQCRPAPAHRPSRPPAVAANRRCARAGAASCTPLRAQPLNTPKPRPPRSPAQAQQGQQVVAQVRQKHGHAGAHCGPHRHHHRGD